MVFAAGVLNQVKEKVGLNLAEASTLLSLIHFSSINELKTRVTW